MLDIARGVCGTRLRLEGADALRDRFRHLGHAASAAPLLDYIQRGKDGYAKREELQVPESDMFRAELEQFAASCRSGKTGELSADNANVALAVVYAALRSLERRGQSVRISEVIEETRAKLRVAAREAA